MIHLHIMPTGQTGNGCRRRRRSKANWRWLTGQLAALNAWKQAHVTKCNPDTALPAQPHCSNRSGGGRRHQHRRARPRLHGVLSVDLIVCGSVAVSQRDGVRIGKGAGYSELEIALPTEAGLVDEGTAIHQTQLHRRWLPHPSHHVYVDLAITPTRRSPARRIEIDRQASSAKASIKIS